MDREKMIARHYLETGILGAYETAEIVHLNSLFMIIFYLVTFFTGS